MEIDELVVYDNPKRKQEFVISLPIVLCDFA
jgi:hypothetical protein